MLLILFLAGFAKAKQYRCSILLFYEVGWRSICSLVKITLHDPRQDLALRVLVEKVPNPASLKMENVVYLLYPKP